MAKTVKKTPENGNNRTEKIEKSDRLLSMLTYLMKLDEGACALFQCSDFVSSSDGKTFDIKTPKEGEKVEPNTIYVMYTGLPFSVTEKGFVSSEQALRGEASPIKIENRDIETLGRMFMRASKSKEDFYFDYEIKRKKVSSVRRIKFEFLKSGNKKIVRVSLKDTYSNAAFREELALLEEVKKDSLTGVLNRTYFEEAARDRIDAVQCGAFKHLALLIVDIDDFKTINDEYGHMFGDTTILDLTKVINKYAEKTDVIGRFGGDEFVIVTTNFKNKSDLKERVEILIRDFSKTAMEECRTTKLTCSVGIAFYDRESAGYEKLLENADKALCYVKANGRNGCAEYKEIKRESHLKIGHGVVPKPIDAVTGVSEEIAEFALDLFENSADIRSAIDILLSRVGTRFGLNMIVIREKQLNGKSPVKYSWTDEKHMKYAMDEEVMSISGWTQFTQVFCGMGNYIVPDISRLDDKNPVKQLFLEKGIKSFVIQSLINNGESFGGIVFADCEKTRTWKKERSAFSVIARIIGNYLSREGAFSDMQKKMEHLVKYDELTGLMKYDKFKSVGKEILELAGGDVGFALIAIDISHFKYFNEMFSFKDGDELLNMFANCVVKNNSHVIAACRDYADSFMMFAKKNSEEEDFIEIMEGYISLFKATAEERYHNFQFALCCGIFYIDDPTVTMSAAIDNANMAKKILKDSGEFGIKVFDNVMRESRRAEISMLHRIEEAIDDDDFNVYLQPQISMETGELVGAEALTRWIQKDGSMFMPDDFIPLLEKNGRITDLDYHIYEKVLRMLAHWKEEGIKPVPISVNFSRKHIRNDMFVSYLGKKCEEFKVERNLIEVEITESAFVDDQNALVASICGINKSGFRIAIDDFGKGYSSLSMLREVPAQVVKLDKDFLKNYEGEQHEGMLRNVIRLIKDAEKTVVCEGIETEQQRVLLKELGCDVGQGFLYSKPVPVHVFEKEYLKKGKDIIK